MTPLRGSRQSVLNTSTRLSHSPDTNTPCQQPWVGIAFDASDEADTVTAANDDDLNGLRVAKAVDGEVTWIHSDHLHSATILTGAGGVEIRRLAYAAFGEEL